MYNNSTLTMNGGTIGFSIFGYDDSFVDFWSGTVNNWISTSGKVYFSGGTVPELFAHHSAEITMSGGSTSRLEARDNSTISVSGGSVDEYLQVEDEGTIYLYGSNFTVNGQKLNTGDSLRDYGHMVDLGGQGISWFFLNGNILGTLQDGSKFNTEFLIYADSKADIIVIPEPASLLLLGLGGLVVRKRRRV